MFGPRAAMFGSREAMFINLVWVAITAMALSNRCC